MENVVEGMQKTADVRHANDLELFQAQCRDWIMNGVRERDGGLPVTPFTKPIPTRTVYQIVDGQIVQSVAIDPNVKLPVLPDPLPPTMPAVPFSAVGAQGQSIKIDQTFLMVSKIFDAMGFKL